MNKQRLIDRLHSDDTFNAALNAADELQRPRIASLAESLVSSFADVLAPIVSRIEGDSNFAEELRKTLSSI